MGDMKRQLLLIAQNKIFIEAIQHAFKSEYSITVMNPNAGESQLKKTMKEALYTKILFIDTGEKNIYELFNVFVQRMPWLDNRVVFVTNLRQGNEKLLRDTSQATIAFYGDIISSTLDINSLCNNLLFLAKKKKRISIVSEGMGLYPVFFHDVIASIKTILAHKFNHTLLVFPQDEITSLTFARVLQKIDPEITLDIQNNKKQESEPLSIPKNGKHMVDFINFEAKLKGTYERVRIQSQGSVKSLSHKEKNRSSTPSIFVGASIALIVVFLFLPFFAFFSLLGSIWALEQGKANVAKGFALFAQDAFLISDKIIGNPLHIASFSLGRNTAEGAVIFSDALDMFSQIIEGTNVSRQKLIYGLNLARRLSVIKQYMQTTHGLPTMVKNKVGDFAREEQLLMTVLDVFPEIAGFKGQRTYLVLFQNNAELRPGGGFIGSYGLMTVESGRVIRFTIHDVYDADGQLAGHIEPPFELRKYMGVTHWFLRDSNFDVDFRKNAQTAAFFLEKETGEKVDGVIGVDASFLKNVLAAIGPLFIADFQTTITAENFTFFTQEEIQSHFFPGSRKKKNFLSAVYQEIVPAIQKRISYRQMASLLTDAIDQKHLLLMSLNPAVEEIFTANNFSSTILEKRFSSENIIQDFVGISEANIGQNKVNTYISRKMYQDVAMQKHNRFSQIQLVYTNKSSVGSLFGGDYNNYLRVILPYDSIITSIAFDGKETEFVMTKESYEKPKITDAFEIKKTEELGRIIYGMYVTIPALSTKVIRFTYTTPQKSNRNADVSYDLLVLKQPGTEADSYSLSLHYPRDFIIIKTNKKTRISDNKLSFETLLQEDVRLTANFIKK